MRQGFSKDHQDNVRWQGSRQDHEKSTEPRNDEAGSRGEKEAEECHRWREWGDHPEDIENAVRHSDRVHPEILTRLFSSGTQGFLADQLRMMYRAE
jgi:hypothetical protein